MEFKKYLLRVLQYLEFVQNYFLFKKDMRGQDRFKLSWSMRKVCLGDNSGNTYFDRHYIYHPAWAARILKTTKPEFHIDISSTLHFCSIVSAFIPVKFYDYRPAKLHLDNLSSEAADLSGLHFPDDSISSLSCMHTVEHIGLGRYGDMIDYNGDIKAIKELSRVLSRGGDLLFVVPVGKQSLIQYNAHRIYHPDDVIKLFKEEGLTLKEFSLIPEKETDGGLIVRPSQDLIEKQSYACGCFWFKK